jgi:hypothetical protein
VSHPEEVAGGEQGGLDVVRADEGDAAGGAVDAHGRDGTAQQLSDPAVPLHLRGGCQDAVHKPLQEHAQVAFGVGGLPVDAPVRTP